MFNRKSALPPSIGGMLTGEAIKQRGIIAHAIDTSWRAASYDLRIGTMIDPDGEIVFRYVLPPRGIVEVISRERVAVPAGLSGSAMVKTSLCNDGILALGIGLIDPGWDGPISSFLINFSKVPRLLLVDEVFLRTTFHTLEGHLKAPHIVRKEDHDIARERQQATVGKIGGSFLNLEEVLGELERKSALKRGVELLTYIAIGGTLLTFLGFVLTWFTSNLAGKPTTSSIVVSQPLAAEIDELRRENAALRFRTSALERQREVGPKNDKKNSGNAN